ncbi:unnamed protein product [Linum trigynum]|uniref:Uncharacterized protein n=1 Tax=Linum trigynum TaxID=586398 RepID=A0AAV2F8V9_9ROSI
MPNIGRLSPAMGMGHSLTFELKAIILLRREGSFRSIPLLIIIQISPTPPCACNGDERSSSKSSWSPISHSSSIGSSPIIFPFLLRSASWRAAISLPSWSLDISDIVGSSSQLRLTGTGHDLVKLDVPSFTGGRAGALLDR